MNAEPGRLPANAGTALSSLRDGAATRLHPDGLQSAVAGELLALGAELLHPTRGIMRGIYPCDGDRKLLRFKISELRKIERFIAGACRALTPEPSIEETTNG